MSWRDDVNSALTQALGVEVACEEGFGPPTFSVPADQWISALSALRAHGFTYFDWLTAVDELEEGFTVACHLAALRGPGAVEHLLVRTRVAKAGAVLPTATGVFAGASWHERETHEMFGIDFAGHPALVPLLLPDEFEGHPLRKDFVLAARVAKAWPGAKEPGESDHDTGRSPSRRRMAPPGVPGPDAWGPRPPGSPTPDPSALTAPGPTRPARRERGERGERPARRQPPGTAGAPARSARAGETSGPGEPPSGEQPQSTAPPAEGAAPPKAPPATDQPPPGEQPPEPKQPPPSSRGGDDA